MNRIRQVGEGKFQVIITPDYRTSPSDTSLLLGNWDDEKLVGYYVLEFESMNDAVAEALNYPDIDWYKMILNHKYVFGDLKGILEKIVSVNGYNVELRSKLMEPNELKNAMFDRVLSGGGRFNVRTNVNDIISFRIVSPWTKKLNVISKTIENYRYNLQRDDLRIKEKKLIDGKMIQLIGITTFGTTYEIKLMPSLLSSWTDWYNQVGYKNEKMAMVKYGQIIKSQNEVDKNVAL